jgi:hypothetical protein
MKAGGVLAQLSRTKGVLAQFWHSRGKQRAKTIEMPSNKSFGINDGLVGAARFELATPCAQGRCATRLRYAPTFTVLFILKHFLTRRAPRRGQKQPKTGPTVTNPISASSPCSKAVRPSFAFRFSFCRASLSISSFICEYFLNTFARRDGVRGDTRGLEWELIMRRASVPRCR